MLRGGRLMAIPIVWGQKGKSSALGFVADYCVVCRDIRAFVVHRLSVVAHVYWIPTGAPREVDRVATCTECRVSTAANYGADVRYVRDFDGDIGRLAAMTNPRANMARAEQRHREAQAAGRSLPEDARLQTIAEPFQLLAPTVENLYARDRRAARRVTAKDVAMLFSPIHVIETGPSTGALAPAASVCLIASIILAPTVLLCGIPAAGKGEPLPWWSYTGAI